MAVRLHVHHIYAAHNAIPSAQYCGLIVKELGEIGVFPTILSMRFSDRGYCQSRKIYISILISRLDPVLTNCGS